MQTGNLFADIPGSLPHEHFEELLQSPGLKIERIVSTGQSTPEGEWYDQDRDEWVLLLQGSAGLQIDGEQETRELVPGDHIHLPAHLRHRVEWTASDQTTIWLAVHFE